MLIYHAAFSLPRVSQVLRFKEIARRYMTATKEWKDGAVAVIMRNMSKERGGFKPSHVHKWIVLDGDIDAEWIESMNTVMDDNKVYTASDWCTAYPRAVHTQ